MKRNCFIYGFPTLELNLAFIWKHCIWLMRHLFNTSYFKSLRISVLGPKIAECFLLFHFLRILLDFSKTARATGLLTWKKWGLAKKKLSKGFLFIKNSTLRTRWKSLFLIIQRAERLPTSDFPMLVDYSCFLLKVSFVLSRRAPKQPKRKLWC